MFSGEMSFLIPGSSPLTRGTLNSVSIVSINSRFIPAYAGNSYYERFNGRSQDGSSPLTRGTPLLRCSASAKNRFIPAYAGNSKELGADTAFHLVHPRLRGELGSSCASREFHSAVHPRLRGELAVKGRGVLLGVRFIPAYAGNSISNMSSARLEAVHPRLRGELFRVDTDRNIVYGSSPLTRGTQVIV